MEDLNSYCGMWCGGELRKGRTPDRLSGFEILKEKDRTLYFSLVGHEPSSAEIAIIGLNPAGTQLNVFLECYEKTGDFDRSRKESAFSNKNLRRNLINMLDFLDVPSRINLKSAEEIFTDAGREKVMMTSVVKCASLSTKPGRRSAAWDITEYDFAVKCASYRLLYDLSKANGLKAVFILGRKAAVALKAINKDGKPLYIFIEDNIAPIIELPHPSGANSGRIRLFIEQSDGELRQRAVEKIRNIKWGGN